VKTTVSVTKLAAGRSPIELSMFAVELKFGRASDLGAFGLNFNIATDPIPRIE
jgi:hypothetical protein